MLYRAFAKTKPIHFLILPIVLCIIYGMYQWLFWKVADFSWVFTISGLALLIFDLFLVDFIAQKNNLTRKNALVILLFTVVLACFPKTLLQFESILAGTFLLIALRRIISLRTQNNSIQKIFDSTFWILMAALINEWALLFLLALYAAMILFKTASVQQLSVPLVPIVLAAILLGTYFSITEQWSEVSQMVSFSVEMQLTEYTTYPENLITFGLLSLASVSLVYYILKTQRQKGLKKETSVVILMMSLVAAVGFGLGHSLHHNLLLPLVFCAVVWMANLLQRLPKAWMQEGVLWLTVCMPLLILVLQLTTKS